MYSRFVTTASMALFVSACGGDVREKGGASNSTSNGTTNNGSTTNNRSNNDNCNFRFCPGQQIGDGWTVVAHDPGYYYSDMWIESPGEIWLAVQDGRVRRMSGTTWEDFVVPGAEQLGAIEGDGRGNIWVTAYPSAIYRFDGGEFVPATVVDGPERDRGFTELAHDPATGEVFANSQWFGIWKRVGEQWEFAAQSTGQLFNVVTCGGTQWFAANSQVTTIDDDRAVVWGLPEAAGISGATVLDSGEVVGAGDEVLYYDGDYKRMTRGEGPLSLSGVTGTSLDDLWAFYNGFGDSFVYRYDGRDWREVAQYDRQNPIRAIHTDTPGQVRVVFKKTSSIVLDEQGNESNGTASVAPGALTLGGDYPVHFFTMNDYIANSYRWTPDTGWEAISGLSSGGISIWAASLDDIWRLGERGRINRFQAGDDRLVSPGFDVSMDLSIIRGTATGNVWIAGWDQVIQWDGTQWTDHSDFDAGTERQERPVALVAEGDEAWVWRDRQLFHWNGSSWTHVQPDPRVSRLGCEDGDLVGIATQPPAVLRGGPSGWVTSTNVTDENTSVLSAWMTTTSDAWFLTQDFPGVRYWDGTEWQPSLDNPMILTLRIEELPDGSVYMMGTDTLFVRR